MGLFNKKDEPAVTLNELTDDDKVWVKEHEEKLEKGEQMIIDASTEALEYMEQVFENSEDINWRKMAVQTQSLEMGMGHALIDHIAPFVNEELRKNIGKELGLKKQASEMLIAIFLGRTIKNVQKALEDERTD